VPRPAALVACLAFVAAACVVPSPEPSTTPPPKARPEPALAYRGVNLAGAEFGTDRRGGGHLPGVHGVDYIYPDPIYATGYDSADYYLGKGANVFRVPFRWERLQPTRRADLDASELERLKGTAGRLTKKGASVILDLHNFGRYRGKVVGSTEVPDADLADVWARLALAFKSNPQIIFGLMNEPHDMPTEQWASAANAAIAAVRSAGAGNLILVPGNDYSGAHSWSKASYGTPNAVALLQIVDPLDRYAFEVHQYLDQDFSGTSAECVGPSVGSEQVRGFTEWLRINKKKGFVAEIGAGPGPTCLRALDDLLDHLEQNTNVYLGWAYWAGGPWWGDYVLSIEPSGSTDKPQMGTLEQHFTAPGPARPH
jgi:endoglucanase